MRISFRSNRAPLEISMRLLVETGLKGFYVRSIGPIALVIVLLNQAAVAQEPFRIRLADSCGKPVTDALVEVVGFTRAVNWSRHDEPESPRWEDPEFLGTTDDFGCVSLDLPGRHFRVPAKMPIDLGLTLRVLTQNGTLTLISLKTIFSNQEIVVPDLAPKLLTLENDHGAALGGAIVEILAVDGAVLPDLFRRSGRLTRIADAHGLVDLRVSTKACSARVSHPSVGEGCEEIDCPGMTSIHVVHKGADTESWSITLRDDVHERWSIYCGVLRPRRHGLLPWKFDLAPGQRRRLRLEPHDHVSLRILIESSASALAVEMDQDTRSVLLTPCEWELCEGFPDLGEHDASRLKLVALCGAGHWPLEIFAWATASSRDGRYSLPHPPDRSELVVFHDLDPFEILEPWWCWHTIGSIAPRRVDDALSLDGTKLREQEVHISRSGCEVLLHDVTGRVLDFEGRPAAGVPVLALTESERITMARSWATPGPESTITKPPFDEPLRTPDDEARLTFTDSDGRFTFVHMGYIYQLRCGYGEISPGVELGDIEKDHRPKDHPSIRWRVERPVVIRLPE